MEFPLLVGITNQISITNYSNIVNDTSTILPKNPLDVDLRTFVVVAYLWMDTYRGLIYV
jgi:hypothetical protein